MSTLHVAQINFVPVPEGLGANDIFEQWPSLVDVAEAVASSGTRVSVIQATTRPLQVIRNGIGYHFSDIRGTNTAADRGRRFASLLDDIKADVLHVHGLEYAEDAYAISQSLPQLPILFQDHANRLPSWWQRPRWRRWYTAASGAAFTAPELARPFIDAGLLAPSSQLFSIPESSCRFTRGSRARARAETGLYGDPCIIWVGHLSDDKDPMTVLDGISQAAATLPGLQLWCVFGNAPLLSVVQQRVDRDPHLAGRVHLLGKVPHGRVELLMRAADLYVSGSHAESCGYALLEAMACGVTPIVTDIPSFRALVGDVGSLWPCGDATRLAEAIIRTAAHRPSPQSVREHFDHALSFEAVGRQWLNAYTQIVDRPRRSVP